MIAPYTNVMQTTIHVDIDVIDSALGDELVMPMNKLMSIKNRVISNAILPGTISWGMIKLICNEMERVSVANFRLQKFF